jgi:hypothetical protein
LYVSEALSICQIKLEDRTTANGPMFEATPPDTLGRMPAGSAVTAVSAGSAAVWTALHEASPTPTVSKIGMLVSIVVAVAGAAASGADAWSKCNQAPEGVVLSTRRSSAWS